MIEHYNHWLPKLIKVNAITLGRHIFYAEQKVSDRLRKHEEEHVLQYLEDGIIPFLICYFYEYIKNRSQGMSHYKAYKNISYEVEARNAE